VEIVICHAILTGKLQMYRISAKFVPRLLTHGQKENRVSISQDMLANADADENFMKNRLGSSQLFFIPHIEGTMCENDVSYLIKLFYSQSGLFLNTPHMKGNRKYNL
jgi:hypothetical protein